MRLEIGLVNWELGWACALGVDIYISVGIGEYHTYSKPRKAESEGGCLLAELSELQLHGFRPRVT